MEAVAEFVSEPPRRRRSPAIIVQSITDRTIQRVQEAHGDLFGRGLHPDARKRLSAALKAAISPHILPPDGSETAA